MDVDRNFGGGGAVCATLRVRGWSHSDSINITSNCDCVKCAEAMRQIAEVLSNWLLSGQVEEGSTDSPGESGVEASSRRAEEIQQGLGGG